MYRTFWKGLLSFVGGPKGRGGEGEGPVVKITVRVETADSGVKVGPQKCPKMWLRLPYIHNPNTEIYMKLIFLFIFLFIFFCYYI